MAVFTQLSRAEIEHFLSFYSLGKLISAEGIAEGVSNSNYLLTVGPALKKYILTVFEPRTDANGLPFFMHLTEWLSDRGIPCPRPVKDRDGRTIRELKNKPASIVSFLEGANNPEVTPEHLSLLGALMARLHFAAEGFLEARRNALSIDGWQQLFAQFRHHAGDIYWGLERELAGELAWLEAHWPSGLPRGIVHADLFPDNVFFSQKEELKITGVIDFYFAADDCWLYDLMIAMNAWCFDAAHRFVPERARALFAAYERLRPLTDAERAAMPVMGRAAAMRFVCTRCYDWLYRAPNALVVPKDPMEYIAKLRFHRKIKDWRGYGL